MDLPVRIDPELPADPVVSVDGAWGARGLNLSHWPGNATPRDLRHDLSTGCVLRWARLGREERERRAAGCTAIVNNHYDTDGACALFAARFPERALEREERLLAAARAGDFFRIPDERALALDALVGGLEGGAQERTDHLLAELPKMLDARELPRPDLWRPVVEDARADIRDLGACERRDDPALALVTWTAPRATRSSRPHAPANGFDPGRHPLFELADVDRVLVVAPGPDGTSYRLVISTLSWFDLEPARPLPRPDLPALAARLNELEGTDPASPLAWRAQPRSNASPELWFGAAELESFAEHSPALRPSSLDPGTVHRELLRALPAPTARG